MKNRISELFEKKKAGILSIFYTAGFPQLENTVAIARHLEAVGADLIEIGIPFSDPVADGPVIQESNKLALENGISVKRILEQVREVRKNVSLPIILMGYLNPVMQYGVERFCEEAASSGVDGLILPDMPMEEYLVEYKVFFDRYGLLNTFLISPTTSEERIRKIDAETNGFIYAVSASSTTGTRNQFADEQLTYFGKLQGMKLKSPFLIGFGISDHTTFQKACDFGSGAIVGSAFVRMLKNSTNLEADIEGFVKNIRG